MMGRQRRDQGRLFYEFRLEDRIPENHLLRRINVFVTVVLADLHKELEPHYSDIGRPSVDPELMIRMLIVGYCYGIRSERRLCQEVALHLAYRCALGRLNAPGRHVLMPVGGDAPGILQLLEHQVLHRHGHSPWSRSSLACGLEAHEESRCLGDPSPSTTPRRDRYARPTLLCPYPPANGKFRLQGEACTCLIEGSAD